LLTHPIFPRYRLRATTVNSPVNHSPTPENNGGVVTMTSKQRGHNPGVIENTTAYYRGHNSTVKTAGSCEFVLEQPVLRTQIITPRGTAGRFASKRFLIGKVASQLLALAAKKIHSDAMRAE
jgi:hypothetical protein